MSTKQEQHAVKSGNALDRLSAMLSTSSPSTVAKNNTEPAAAEQPSAAAEATPTLSTTAEGEPKKKKHPEHAPSTNLFINYLPSHVDEAALTHVINKKLETISPVSVFVMRHLDTKQSKGFAFALFKSIDDARIAKKKLNGHRWHQKRLQVKFAEEPPVTTTTAKHAAPATASKYHQDPTSAAATGTPPSGAHHHHHHHHHHRPAVLPPKPGTVMVLASDGSYFYQTLPNVTSATQVLDAGHTLGKGVSEAKQSKQAANETNLYIKGIPSTWTKENLVQYFGRFGPIEDCAVMIEDQRTTGMAFVNYADTLTANRVIMECNGTVVDPTICSVPLHVRFARKNKPATPFVADLSSSTKHPCTGKRIATGPPQNPRTHVPLPTMDVSCTDHGCVYKSPTGGPAYSERTRKYSSDGDDVKKTRFGPLLVHDPYAMTRYRMEGEEPSRTEINNDSPPSTSMSGEMTPIADTYPANIPLSATLNLPTKIIDKKAPLSNHSCAYCKNGTSVIMENMPYEATQCDMAVRKLLACAGLVVSTECIGNGQAIATFAEHVDALQAVQVLCTGPHNVALLDCTQLEPDTVMGDFI